MSRPGPIDDFTTTVDAAAAFERWYGPQYEDDPYDGYEPEPPDHWDSDPETDTVMFSDGSWSGPPPPEEDR